MTTKRHRQVSKPSTSTFYSTKAHERTKETKTNSILSNTRALKSSRVPPTTGGKCASDENDYSSERNSTERLKGRCFIPRGISSYSLSQSADRSFIEISAHRTCFNNSCILLKRCTRSTNQKLNLGAEIKNKKTPRTNVIQTCALFIRMTSLDNFNVSTSVKWFCL